MLSNDQIRDEVLRVRRPRAEVRKRIPEAIVDPKLRDLAHLALRDQFRGFGSGAFFRQEAQIGAMLTALPIAERERFFATMMPALAPFIARGWDLQSRRPFQPRWDARPFRAPDSPNVLELVRAVWFLSLAHRLPEYTEDVRWLAAWSGHVWDLAGVEDHIGWLLAAAIDSGDPIGDEVFEILSDSVQGRHPICQISPAIITALLACSRPEGWKHLERVLLSAQREEGLRQSILERVQNGHPDAFRHFARVIVRENLARFAATVRAVDVWFGLLWDSVSAPIVNDVLVRVLSFLDEPAARAAALDSSDGETLYLALWATAFEDAAEAVAPATALIGDASPERRFIAVHTLVELRLPGTLELIVPSLNDPDLRVAARALDGVAALQQMQPVKSSELFDACRRLMDRLPAREMKLDPLVWPWWKRTLRTDAVSLAMVEQLADRSPAELLPYLPSMGPESRCALTARLGRLSHDAQGNTTGGKAPLSKAARRILLELLPDPSDRVSESVFAALSHQPLQDDEVEMLLALLSRTSSNLRKRILTRLDSLPSPRALEIGRDLVASKNRHRRLGGLELLRSIHERAHATPEVRALVVKYSSDHPQLEQAERAHIEAIIGSGALNAESAESSTAAPTLDDAFGLLPPARVRKARLPRDLGVPDECPGVAALLESLCECIEMHAQTEIEIRWDFGGSRRSLLIDSAIPDPDSTPLESDLKRCPVADILQNWLASASPEGDDLVRALSLWNMVTYGHFATSDRIGRLTRTFQRNRERVRLLRSFLVWANKLAPAPNGSELLLDLLETGLARRNAADPSLAGEVRRADNRDPVRSRAELVQWWGRTVPEQWSDRHGARLYELLRFGSQNKPGPQLRPGVAEFISAYATGAVAEVELIDLLLRRPPLTPRDSPWLVFAALREMTSLKPDKRLVQFPALLETVRGVRDRIIAVEMTRGERPLVSSDIIGQLRSAGGLDNLIRIIDAIGTATLQRAKGYGTPSRGQSLAHLLSVTHPQPGETPAAFAAHLRPLNIPQSRFLELAVFAPQWAAHVEHTLSWPGLEEGVWWLHAHTRPRNEWDKTELHEAWAAQISKRTPILADDLGDGAVDVAWFHACHKALGKDRWSALDQAAKYASSGGGHKPAQLFADALRGEIDRKDLAQRIKKRQPDAVRTLGLVPLPAAAKQREAELLARYEQLQEFRRESRKFGSMKQATEKRAVEIAMDNLARTAGYADPLRLQWAMEKRAIADLARGPITVKASETEVSLALDADGKPELTIIKKGKALASIPAALKKHEKIQELKSRAGDLKKQASRMRKALEESMCRGDTFTGAELPGLFEHPILAPMLARLVFIGEGIMGYPATDGKARGKLLLAPGGKAEPIKPAEELRIAHPADLFASSTWHEWQRDCFAAERVQPFKQVFREFYPLTPAERAEGQLGAEGASRSTRYSGHQVVPRQAIALLGQRGWVAAPEEGVSRTFHAERLTVNLGFMETFYTPAEIDGLTIEDITFTNRGEYKAIPLTEVPPRIFSEVMRDLDLVVSVAHRGGVDPEATESTVETRAALLRETASLLGLSNITFRGSHAVIKGDRATYSLHLGSAITHVQPGGALFIVPVHSQHRGRIFLPFADDDPKTAEVLSKALLLARDEEIRDPSILQQIGRAS